MVTSDASSSAPSATGACPAAQLTLMDLPVQDDAGDSSPINPLAVLRALRSLRIIRAGQDEIDLQEAIAAMLTRYGIPAQREFSFGPRCRADVWCGGVVIEVKKRRPVFADLLRQITRYAQQSKCRAIIVVLERSVILPETIEGKPVRVLSLNANWGVAL